MKYIQYKGVIERKYNMSLKKIMHQLCVAEGLNAAEGAKKLGIAKQVFVYWRQHFRLEERQLFFDRTVDELMNLKSRYSVVTETTHDHAADDSSQNTLDDLEDVVEGLIKYYKYIHYSSEGFSLKAAKLPLYTFSKVVIGNYKKGELSKELQAEC